jgi:hypothetical protein
MRRSPRKTIARAVLALLVGAWLALASGCAVIVDEFGWLDRAPAKRAAPSGVDAERP